MLKNISFQSNMTSVGKLMPLLNDVLILENKLNKELYKDDKIVKCDLKTIKEKYETYKNIMSFL